jgi:hypothetical protein
VWNVDVFGILRGKYYSPAFAIKIGENAIRNCFRDQLTSIRKEGMENMGLRPCIFSEIGIPYDMDEKYAYKTGNYSSQIAALDANHFALEGMGGNGFTLWVYVASVCLVLDLTLGSRGLTRSEQPLLGRSVEWRRSLYLFH